MAEPAPRPEEKTILFLYAASSQVSTPYKGEVPATMANGSIRDAVRYALANPHPLIDRVQTEARRKVEIQMQQDVHGCVVDGQSVRGSEPLRDYLKKAEYRGEIFNTAKIEVNSEETGGLEQSACIANPPESGESPKPPVGLERHLG